MPKDRDDVIRQVRGLQATADAESASAGERENALVLSQRLRAKYDITDEELVEHDELGGVFEGLFSGFRWGSTVRDEVDRIWAEVDALVDRMLRDEKGSSRAEAVNSIYGRLRTKLGDTTTEPIKGTLKDRRNQALYDYFTALDANDRKERAQWATEDEEESDPEAAKMWEEFRLGQLYDRAASRVKVDGASLNKAQVAKIVAQVREKRADEARWAKQRADREAIAGKPCVFCGSTEIKMTMNDKRRGKPITYEMSLGTEVYYRDGEPVPAHTRCLAENREKAEQ